MNSLIHTEINEAEERIRTVLSERTENGGSFIELEEKVKDIGNSVHKLKTLLNLKSSSSIEEQQAIENLKASQLEAQGLFEASKEKTNQLELQCEASVKEYEEKLAFVAETSSLVATLTTGMSSSNGHENGYMDQLTSIF